MTDKTKKRELISVTADFHKDVIEKVVQIANVEGTTKAALLREGSVMIVKKYKK